MSEICEQCKFYLFGKCHRHPPVPNPDQFGNDFDFPRVSPLDWCGEFSDSGREVRPWNYYVKGENQPPEKGAYEVIIHNNTIIWCEWDGENFKCHPSIIPTFWRKAPTPTF